MKIYELWLPVYKQGDDLYDCILNSNNLKQAFEMQAAKYEDAARMCKRMASVASEHDLDIQADTHYIGISCENEKTIQKLIDEKILSVAEWDDFE